MIALVDTNVALDVMLGREPHLSASAAVLAAVETARCRGLLCATTVTTIHYIAERRIGGRATLERIAGLMSIFGVAAVNQAVLGSAMAIAGLILAWLFYGSKTFSAEKAKQKLKPLHTLLVNKYYIDEFYLFLVRRVQQGIAIVANWLEQKVIIGMFVNGIAGGAKDAAHRLRESQTGRVNSYVTTVLAGITLAVLGILYFVVWR